MPVAKMPGEAHELARIGMAYLHDWLRRRPHENPAPVPKPQAIALRHHLGMRQIEQNLLAVIGRQLRVVAVARFEIERHAGLGLGLRPQPFPAESKRAMHWYVPATVRRPLYRCMLPA